LQMDANPPDLVVNSFSELADALDGGLASPSAD